MADPKKYRKRPVVIEAMEYTRDNCHSIHEWMGINHGEESEQCGVDSIIINTLEGDHEARPGDFIIRGIAGEFCPCKPDIFAATYEEANDG